MTFHTWVQLDGQRVLYDQIRKEPDASAWLMSRAWADKSALCLCRSQPLRLVTRCRSGRFNLAVWPLGGAQHDPRCAFFRVDPELSGRTGYTVDAIRADEQGTVIRFAGPLFSNTADTTGPSEATTTETGVARASVGLLGLLHHVWEEAGLTTWHAEKHERTWGFVVNAAREEIASTTINRQPGEDVLYVVPPDEIGGRNMGKANIVAFDAFMNTLRGSNARVRRGFVLGELEHIRTTTHGFGYRLEGQRARQVFVRRTLHERLRSSCRHAMADAGVAAGGRRILLAYIECSKKGYAVALDATVMLTCPDYIPADSSYEVQAAIALKKAGRSFIKPVRYDQQAFDLNEAVFPDFVLTDEEPQAYFEVWGLPGRADYEARKRVKQGLYNGTRLYEWDIKKPMPSLAHPNTRVQLPRRR